MKKVLAAMLIAFALTITAAAYSNRIQNDLQNNLVRLHIIANSDSDYDQFVKLCVRDAILENEQEKLYDTKSIANALPEAEQTARSVLERYGAEYDVHAEYGKFDFPKKEYKNMTLPGGRYYGVRIILGSGEGKNWWCVLYPPLCTASDSDAVLPEESQKLLREKLSPEAYEIITDKAPKAKIKFRIVEAVRYIAEARRHCSD